MPGLALDHVVIAVHDLDAATEDYRALLGRDPSWRGEHPPYGTRNTLFRIDNTYVELLALAGRSGDGRWAGELSRFLEAQGEGVYALALGTEDVDAAVRAARVRGLGALDPADGEGVDALTGARRAWRNAMTPLKATNGARLFFIQHRSPADALPPSPVTAGDGAFVKRMDHAVVLSADMDGARRLWGDVLDARLALDRTFPERNTRILFFRLGDITVEISGSAAETRDGAGRPDRLWGLAWGVDNLQAMCDRLAAAGIETSGPRPGIKPGTLVATAKGPRTHGVATLLIEHTPASFGQEARAPQGRAFDNAPQRRAFAALALDHVVVSTPDLPAAAATWETTLGLTASAPLEPEGAHLRLATLPAGNAFIELVQPLAVDHRIARTMADRGPGMFSIAIRVDDVEAAVRDLRAKGVVVSDAADGVFPGTRIARIDKFSANGVAIQLIQRP